MLIGEGTKIILMPELTRVNQVTKAEVAVISDCWHCTIFYNSAKLGHQAWKNATDKKGALCLI